MLEYEMLGFWWAYYLDFTNSPNKIAYAASMGPVSHVNQAEGIKARLGQFKAISAREAGTADTIASLCHARPAILPDPTLLLSQDRWREAGWKQTFNRGTLRIPIYSI